VSGEKIATRKGGVTTGQIRRLVQEEENGRVREVEPPNVVRTVPKGEERNGT